MVSAMYGITCMICDDKHPIVGPTVMAIDHFDKKRLTLSPHYRIFACFDPAPKTYPPISYAPWGLYPLASYIVRAGIPMRLAGSASGWVSR